MVSARNPGLAQKYQICFHLRAVKPVSSSSSAGSRQRFHLRPGALPEAPTEIPAACRYCLSISTRDSFSTARITTEPG